MAEEKVEECYREGLAVTTELSLLWHHYIKWCHERVQDTGGTDSTRLRVSPL